MISAGFSIVVRWCEAQGPLARGNNLPAIFFFFYDGFLLIWCNFKFEGVLFRSDFRHNDRVDSLCEYATKPFVVSKFRPFLVQDFHRIINMSNRTDCTSGAAITYPSGVHEFTRGFSEVNVAQSFDFYVVFCLP